MATTSRSPAACAHDSSRRPASGSAAVAPRHPVVQVEPPVEPGVGRERHEGAVVDVADGDHPAGAAHAGHLPQRGDRIGQVLQHLVGVDDVERVVVGRERVDVADLERDVHPARVGGGPRLGQRIGGDVDAHHPAGRHAGGQVDGDRARAAADVEQVEPGPQRREQVAGGVLGGAPAVRLQHRLGMAVGVGVHARSLPHRPLSGTAVPT